MPGEVRDCKILPEDAQTTRGLGVSRSTAVSHRRSRADVASLLELLEQAMIGEPGTTSVINCEILDQSRLQAVLEWLAFEDVEIVSVEPAEGTP